MVRFSTRIRARVRVRVRVGVRVALGPRIMFTARIVANLMSRVRAAGEVIDSGGGGG